MSNTLDRNRSLRLYKHLVCTLVGVVVGKGKGRGVREYFTTLGFYNALSMTMSFLLALKFYIDMTRCC